MRYDVMLPLLAGAEVRLCATCFRAIYLEVTTKLVEDMGMLPPSPDV